MPWNNAHSRRRLSDNEANYFPISSPLKLHEKSQVNSPLQNGGKVFLKSNLHFHLLPKHFHWIWISKSVLLLDCIFGNKPCTKVCLFYYYPILVFVAVNDHILKKCSREDFDVLKVWPEVFNFNQFSKIK